MVLVLVLRSVCMHFVLLARRRLFPPRILIVRHRLLLCHAPTTILHGHVNRRRLGWQGLGRDEFIVHLRTHTSKCHEPDGPDTPPTRIRTASTGPTSPTSLSTTFLRAVTIRSTYANETRTNSNTAPQHTALRCQSRKEPNTVIDTHFGRIFSQIAFVLDDPARHIERTTRRKHTRQTADFERQEHVGAIAFTVRSRANRAGRTGTACCAALWTVVHALP